MKFLRRIFQVIAIIAIATVMLIGFTTTSKATELSTDMPIKVAEGASLDQIINAGHKFISNGEKGDVAGESEKFASVLSPIGSILAGIGVVIFFVVLAIMAIKWIVAKPEDKAKLKQAFVGYVIAAIVFFGAIGIWRLVRDLMIDVENSIEKSQVEVITVANYNENNKIL